MDLFLRKSLTGWDIAKAKGKTSTGEQRGGAYIARVQTGYEKDGSPKYRYFNEKEYEAYLSGDKEDGDKKGEESKKKGDGLKDKQDKERKEETHKQSKLFSAAAKKEKKKKEEKVKKSLPLLYLEVNDE